MLSLVYGQFHLDNGSCTYYHMLFQFANYITYYEKERNEHEERRV